MEQTEKKIKALIKASNQLQNAWLDVYQVSSDEMTSKFTEIRNEIHNLELKMMYMVEDMTKEMKEQRNEE